MGSLAGIVQGVWEMGSGVATATGGTVISCGTMVLCFAGGGAAVVGGSVVTAHGTLVTSASLVNTVEAARALFSSAHGSALLRKPVEGHPDAKIVRSKTPVGSAREYEARVLNKPDPDVEIEVNGVKFDWYEGDTLLDAKHAGESRSWYDVSKPDEFTRNFKVKDVRQQAQRQVNALQGSTFTHIEWRVADPKVAKVLEEFFKKAPDLQVKITVVYVP